MSDERLQKAVELQKAGRHGAAQRIYREVLEEDPGNLNAMQLLATTALAQNKLEPARKLLDHVLQKAPRHSVAHHNIAYVYGSLGDIDQAMAHYRAAVELNPRYAEAYFNLVNTVTIAADDPVVAAIEGQLERPDLSDEDLGFLHFAAAKVFDDTAQYDRAFAHFAAGNQHARRPFDAKKNGAAFAAIAEVFTPSLIGGLQQHGNTSERPVFVVGMPRSGTTLVEQILSGHPGIFGAGELGDVFSMTRQIAKHSKSGAEYPAALRDLNPRAIHGFAKTYVARVSQLGGAVARVIDKQPLNLIHLGLIAVLLPRARIIRCRRDALDTCLSCYFQKFRSGNAFSFDLGDLGAFCRDLETLAGHWRKAVPNDMLEISYEELVAEPEPVARAMIEFCGLEWDDNCLRIENRNGPILTASRSQARQPIYRDSVRKWHRYRDHLGPLIEALGPLADVSP